MSTTPAFVDPLPGAPPATDRCSASFTDQATARPEAALHNADPDRPSAPNDLQPQTSPYVTDVPGRLCAQRLADLVVDLARLALAFGRIDRTAVYHPDGVTPESDTDHTVMLVWVACALAARCYPGLEVGLVAQFAAVHDAPEVYAGDTQTLRIDTAGRAAKADRERAAAARLRREFAAALPWFPDTIDRYEAQQEPEARFVRGVDKVLPKAVHLLDGAAGLREFGIGRTELAEVLDRQREDMHRYVGEFTELMALRTELADRVLDATDTRAAAGFHTDTAGGSAAAGAAADVPAGFTSNDHPCISVGCRDCSVMFDEDDDWCATIHFPGREEAIAAVTEAGWTVGAEGARCRECTAEQTCRTSGHDWSAWALCRCDGTTRGHTVQMVTRHCSRYCCLAWEYATAAEHGEAVSHG